MTDYEILLMLDPEAAEERHDEILARIRELVQTGGGTWQGHEPWGRRKLAYEIDHKGEGVYHLVTFSAEAETLDEISRVLKIADPVMRHMATRQIKNVRRTGPPPREDFGPPPRDDAEASAPERVEATADEDVEEPTPEPTPQEA